MGRGLKIFGLVVGVGLVCTVIGRLSNLNQPVSLSTKTPTGTKNTPSRVTHKATHTVAKTTSNHKTAPVPSTPKKTVSNITPPKQRVGLGESVQVGPYLITLPESVTSPILNGEQHNVLEFTDTGTYLFVEVDVKNTTNKPQFVGASMFTFQFTPPNEVMEPFQPDPTEGYNYYTDATSNNQFYYASPYTHILQPGVTEKIALVYDDPMGIGYNTSGNLAILFTTTNGQSQLVSLDQNQ